MSRMVSARIPDAVYDQALDQLQSLGATPTELIKCAFDYLIQENALPSARSKKAASSSMLEDASKREFLQNFFRKCTLSIDISSDPEHDKLAAIEARTAKYEALA